MKPRFAQQKIVFIIITSLFTCTGCYHMELEAPQLEQSVYVSSTTPAPFVRLKEFSIRTNGSWGVFGLLTLKKPQLASLLKEEIAHQQGDAVINLTIRTQTTFSDALIGIVSVLGLIYQPRSVFITGTVISFTKESTVLPRRSADFAVVRKSGGIDYRSTGIVNGETAFFVKPSERSTP